MASRRCGDHQHASRAAPSVPGSTTSNPNTASSRLGRTLQHATQCSTTRLGHEGVPCQHNGCCNWTYTLTVYTLMYSESLPKRCLHQALYGAALASILRHVGWVQRKPEVRARSDLHSV